MSGPDRIAEVDRISYLLVSEQVARARAELALATLRLQHFSEDLSRRYSITEHDRLDTLTGAIQRAETANGTPATEDMRDHVQA